MQVSQLYAELRALRVEYVELVKFLVECGLDVLRPLLFLGRFHQFLALWVAVAARQFFLDVLYLLLQEVFALLFVYVLACLCAYVMLQFEQLHFAV